MKILLIDLSGIFWQYYHIGGGKTENPAYQQTMASIRYYSNQYDVIGICEDRPKETIDTETGTVRHEYVRHQWWQDYKGDRADKPMGAVQQLKDLSTQLYSEGYNVFGADGWEADDVMASLAKALCTEEITLLTADHDLWPVTALSKKVRVQSPRKNGLNRGESEIIAETGLSGNQYEFYLALKGGHDGIPGVKGIGKTLAAQVAKRCKGPDELEHALLNDPESIPRFSLFSQSEVDKLKLWHKLVKLNYDLDLDADKLLKPALPPETPEEVDVIEPPVQPETHIIQAPSAQIEGRTWQNALEPTCVDEAQRAATVLYQSNMFGNFVSPAAVYAALMLGRELGISGAQSLLNVYVVQGRPTLKTEAMLGLVLRSGKANYIKLVESSNEFATVKGHRRDDPDPEPTIITFSMDDARRLGLGNRDQWKKQPENMLVWRAYSKLIRRLFSDITMGLYTVEEMEGV